jgi:hypothetical protein
MRFLLPLILLGLTAGPAVSDLPTARQQVRGLFRQVLERGEASVDFLAEPLADGRIQLRDVLKFLVTSEEYQQKFVLNSTPRQLCQKLCKHILRREAEEKFLEVHSPLVANDWRATARLLCDSVEAQALYGFDRPQERPHRPQK